MTEVTDRLVGALWDPPQRTAVTCGELTLDYRQLAVLTGRVASAVRARERVAVWATPTAHTVVAVLGGLVAGVPVVPINPKSGESELAHILADSTPDLVLAGPDAALPAQLAGLPRWDVTLDDPSGEPDLPAAEPDREAPAFVIYTSGTTGPPKGVVLPRRALATNLDALATAWGWTERDVVVHGLPLFHVHGLILGIVGPLRRGGAVHHLRTFSSAALSAVLASAAAPTVVFGVPTMYHRLAADAEADPALAAVIGGARLLVSGSAGLPASDHERIAASTGQRIVERYGMTETLMNCSVVATGERHPGTVGVPLDGVDLRLVDEAGAVVPAGQIGEIEVRGENLFTGYLNRPDATAEVLRAGWFRTGDVAAQQADGSIRIVGRRATDLIKSGGYKIGAGEIENALLEHPGVAEAAVTGEPDEDLGERIVAWIVAHEPLPAERDLIDHVARRLAPHKRPRVVRFLPTLPRNAMGKVTKRALG